MRPPRLRTSVLSPPNEARSISAPHFRFLLRIKKISGLIEAALTKLHGSGV
jgi:hypothetical protein